MTANAASLLHYLDHSTHFLYGLPKSGTVVLPNKQKSIEPRTILFAPEVEPKDTINVLINYSYIFLHIITP